MTDAVQDNKRPAVRAADITEMLRTSRPVDLKIQDFALLLSEFLDGAIVQVFLFDRELGDFFVRGSTVRLRTRGEVLRSPPEGTILGLCMSERRSVFMREVTRPVGSVVQAEKSLFPLLTGEECLGVVSIEHTSSQGLNPVRVDYTRRFVQDLAIFLDEVRREDSQSLRMTRLSAISEAGVTLISASKINDLLPMVTALSTLIMGAEAALLTLWDEKPQAHVVRDTYGLNDKQQLREMIQLNQATIAETVRVGRPLLVKDLAEDERFAAWASLATTLICHPMVLDGRPLGTITVVNKAATNAIASPCFTEEDVEYFGRLVQYISKALSIALARQDQEELVELDEGTGLHNARHFRRQLILEISRAQRFSTNLVLASCTFQPAGDGTLPPPESLPDAVLISLAAAVRESIRDYDVLARLDGTKLGIIFPQVENGILNALARIEKSVASRLTTLLAERAPVSAEVEYSYAVYPEDGKTDGDLMQALAGELRRKKSGGEWQNLGFVVGAFANKELFFGLSEQQLEKIAGIAEVRQYQAGDEVFHEGAPGNAIYIVLSGEIDIYKEREQGHKVNLSSLTAGSILGEMTLVHRESRSATAVAARDSTVIVLEQMRLIGVFDSDREILLVMVLNIARILAKRLRSASNAYSILYAGETHGETAPT